MSTSQISSRFSIVKTAIDNTNTGNWEGIMGCLSDDFVWEMVVFDGPNLCLNRQAFNDHFLNIPGFALGEAKVVQAIEGEDEIFLHLTTTTRMVAITTPSSSPYELFAVVKISGGYITKFQMVTDSMKLSEI